MYMWFNAQMGPKNRNAANIMDEYCKIKDNHIVFENERCSHIIY